MSVVALTVAVLQTGVVPVLAVMARQLNVSTVDVSWVVTANLLARRPRRWWPSGSHC